MAGTVYQGYQIASQADAVIGEAKAAYSAYEAGDTLGMVKSLANTGLSGLGLASSIKSFANVLSQIRQQGWRYFLACFAAGTLLRTPEGSKPIEEFVVGDLVLSRPEDDPQAPVEAKVVEEVFVRTTWVLSLRIQGQEIRTTSEHPFWVYGKGWRPAGSLEVGDWLSAEDGGWLVVEGAENTGRVETVYNLRVADYHTYFVGCDEWGFSVWAHNSNGACAEAGSSPSITGSELAGKTRTEIRQLAQQKGLRPAGDPTSPDFPRKWKDPVTGQERIRLDRGHTDPVTGQPYNNPNAAVDHVHGYEPNGTTKIPHNGDPHIPTTGE